jgi:hypothetical protein
MRERNAVGITASCQAFGSKWQTMDNSLGEAQKLGEHDYRIGIDRRENTSLADVRVQLFYNLPDVNPSGLFSKRNLQSRSIGGL